MENGVQSKKLAAYAETIETNRWLFGAEVSDAAKECCRLYWKTLGEYSRGNANRVAGSNRVDLKGLEIKRAAQGYLQEEGPKMREKMVYALRNEMQVQGYRGLTEH
jgi:hypothetical protein